MFKLGNCNNCVHEKNAAWIEDDIQVVTDFLCLLGHHVTCIVYIYTYVKFLFQVTSYSSRVECPINKGTLKWSNQV